MSDILASVAVELGMQISGFRAAAAQARRELKGIVQASEALKDIGKNLSQYVSAPLLALGGAALKVGGDFQAAFNRVEAATQASGIELDSLRRKAQDIALDPKLQFSSVEAAQALEALAKNGLSTAQILGGAADASTSLATATGGTLATAADITTDVMNNFGKSAKDAAGLVSNITGTTIASKFSIDDYKLALGQAGAVAGQLGIKFEDFNTALSVTSSGFSSGQDAGTSFKTFLQRLVPQSKEAAASIAELGLKFFDTQGKMLPLREIAGQLQQAFKGLSDQQRNAFGTKIFGTDAIRTALLLAKDGAEGFDKMAVSIGKVNAAAQGGILNKGFVGAFEAFKSSLEGAAQAIADSGILDFATKFANAGATLASSVAKADPVLLQFGVALAAVAAATGPVLVAIGALGAALPAIEAGLALLAGPIGIAVGAFALLGVGIAAVAAGGRDLNKEFADQKSKVDALSQNFLPLLDRYDELKSKTSLSKVEQEELRSIIQRIGEQLPSAITQFDNYGRAIDVSTAAGRRFVEQEQRALTQRNKGLLTEQRQEYARLTNEINLATAALKNRDAQGNLVKETTVLRKVGDDYQAITSSVQLSNEEIAALQARLNGLSESRKNVGALIDQLKGIVPAVQEVNAKGGIVPPLTPETTAKTQKEIDKILLALQKLDKGYDNIASRTTKGLRPKDAPEFIELAIPKDQLPETLTAPPVDISAPAASLTRFQVLMGEFRDNLKLSTTEISDTVANAFAGIASGIGNALANGTSLIEAAGAAILKALGDLAVRKGTLLIADGTANLFIPGLQGLGAATIAAGAGLVAAGAAVGAFASSIGSQGSSGANASTNYSKGANIGQAQTQRIQVEVVGTLKAAGSDLAAVLRTREYRQLRTT